MPCSLSEHSHHLCHVPSRQQLGNLGPPVADCNVTLEDGAVFLQFPRFLANGGVQVIVPPFAALLADATGQVRGNFAPLLGTQFAHQIDHDPVFFFRPRALDNVVDFLPALRTLIRRATRELERHMTPVDGRTGWCCGLVFTVACFWAIDTAAGLFDDGAQCFVLLLGPFWRLLLRMLRFRTGDTAERGLLLFGERAVDW